MREQAREGGVTSDARVWMMDEGKLTSVMAGLVRFVIPCYSMSGWDGDFARARVDQCGRTFHSPLSRCQYPSMNTLHVLDRHLCFANPSARSLSAPSSTT